MNPCSNEVSDEDLSLLRSFKSCALESSCWTHEAHVRVAWTVLSSADSVGDAADEIREGIKRFNASKNSIGYHETITVAFLIIIDSRRNFGEKWTEFATKNPDLFEKSILDAYYSKERLMSRKAKVDFLDSDLKQLPALNNMWYPDPCE